MAIPFTVIGGFLGAGKTTLLNRLLRATTGRRFAVLVNDFGALDIDGALVQRHDGDTIALANGCLCCTIGDSLVTTLFALLDRPQGFDHFVVEASGVADPGKIADLGALEPRLSRDGVVVVVDAATVQERAADRRLADTVERQLAAADLLVLNKLDLVPDPAPLREWLAGRSAAPVLDARHADVPIHLLFGLDEIGEAGDGEAAHGFASWSYQFHSAVDREVVRRLLKRADILRAKGILRFADTPLRLTVLQQVGARIEFADGGPWDGRPSRLVLLGVKPMLSSLPGEATAWRPG
ncbi:MAG: GTP-binding protein [Alphaproteobacteria bacterium]|nr:GTP-binding protein [Alphaproteobacteria bacterium]